MNRNPPRRIGAAVALCACAAAAAPTHAQTFEIAFLPDTQFYCRYSGSRYYSGQQNPFLTQVHWLVQNAAPRNIAFIAHLGDVVDQSNVDAEWIFADQAMDVLDAAGLNYSVVRGNHDLYGSAFTQWFGPARFEHMPTYLAASSDGNNTAHLFTVEGRSFLVFALEWRIDAAEIQWAKDIIAAHPDAPVILTTHKVLGVDGQVPSGPSSTENGEYLWENFVRSEKRIFLVIGGHNHGTAWRVRQNNAGLDVIEVVVDYQSAWANGAGYLRMMAFDLATGAIHASTFSPWMQQLPAGFSIPPGYTPEITTPNADWTYTIDFDARLDPAPCRADINADGAITVQDLLAYLSAFRARDALADMNEDQAITVQDLLAYLSAFRARCDA